MQNKTLVKLIFLGLGLTSALIARDLTLPKSPGPEELKLPLLTDKEKSLQAFSTMLKVIKSPRCINCHPTSDVPRQGDDHHLHLFQVTRGATDHGGLVQACGTCHHASNNTYSNVPGAPHWGLAPKPMGWFGLSDVAIAQALLDKTKNGGRSPAALVKHMSSDSLVLWAWNPGEGRTAPPVSLDAFRKALTEWLDHGACIPEKPITTD